MVLMADCFLHLLDNRVLNWYNASQKYNKDRRFFEKTVKILTHNHEKKIIIIWNHNASLLQQKKYCIGFIYIL